MDKYQSLFDADDAPKRDDKKNEQLAMSNEQLTQEEPTPEVEAEPTPEPEPTPTPTPDPEQAANDNENESE